MGYKPFWRDLVPPDKSRCIVRLKLEKYRC